MARVVADDETLGEPGEAERVSASQTNGIDDKMARADSATSSSDRASTGEPAVLSVEELLAAFATTDGASEDGDHPTPGADDDGDRPQERPEISVDELLDGLLDDSSGDPAPSEPAAEATAVDEVVETSSPPADEVVETSSPPADDDVVETSSPPAQRSPTTTTQLVGHRHQRQAERRHGGRPEDRRDPRTFRHTGPIGPQMAPAQGRPAQGPPPRPPRRPWNGPSPLLLFAVFVVAAAVGLTVAFLLSSPGDGGEAAELATETEPVTESIGPGVGGQLEEVYEVVGLDRLSVDRDGSTLRVTGTVADLAQLQRARDLAATLTDEIEVDTSGVIVTDPASSVSESSSAGADTPSSPVPLLQHELDRLLAARPIVFDDGGAELNEFQRQLLNHVAILLLASPNVGVTIVGDSEEDDELAATRAEEVRDHLLAAGVLDSTLMVEQQRSTGANPSNGDISFKVVSEPAGEGGTR